MRGSLAHPIGYHKGFSGLAEIDCNFFSVKVMWTRIVKIDSAWACCALVMICLANAQGTRGVSIFEYLITKWPGTKLKLIH